MLVLLNKLLAVTLACICFVPVTLASQNHMRVLPTCVSHAFGTELGALKIYFSVSVCFNQLEYCLPGTYVPELAVVASVLDQVSS